MQPGDNEQEGIAVELEDEVLPEVEEREDGSAILRLSSDEENSQAMAHFANIVDEVDQSALSAIVTSLLEKIDHDKQARKKRDELYEEGLRRTGLGDDAPGGAAFPGATRVVHPLLVEACVDFSARLMKELMPPAGPAKMKVLGKKELAKLDKARRKAEFMNWQCTTQIKELRAELDQLSTQLPLGGSQYMKVIFDRRRRRDTVEFVPVDDVYLPYAATNFYTAERRTHVQYLTREGFEDRIKAGMYRDEHLSTPDMPDPSKAQKANDKIEGREADSYNVDGLRTLYEVTTNLDLGDEAGFAPYVITIDLSSRTAVGLCRNWEPDDELKQELCDWVDWGFVPWRGAMAIGLTHMIGVLAGGATGALRALLDSAHINNIPGMLKLKGGPNGQTLNIQPTQIVDIEGGTVQDDIRKLVMPIPFNQPSPTLFQLLGFLVDAAKGVVQTSFEKLSESNVNAPVGTTLALIEQGMVVYSSIHARAHASMAQLLSIIHRHNSAYLTQADIDGYDTGLDIKPEDFDGPSDVVPVSDPQTFSDTQRFAQVQALQQRAAMAPQFYNARKVEEIFVRQLHYDVEEIMSKEPGKDDVDPVSENVAATMGQPIYALPAQDHIAHLQVHLSFLMSPLFGANPAVAKTYWYPMAQHVRDHALNFYLRETHAAIQAMEDGGEELEGSQQAEVIVRVQLECQRALDQVALQFGQQGGFAAFLQSLDQSAQQFKPQPPMPPDHSLEVAQLGAQTTMQLDQQRGQRDQLKLQVTTQDKEKDRQAKLLADQLKAKNDELQRQHDANVEARRQEAENQRNAQDNLVKRTINREDNETALVIANAEIESGERVGISTGTGVNPNP